MLPKTRDYVKRYSGQIKLMYFLIEDGDVLEKSNTIWDEKNNVIESLSTTNNA